jgi:hypothetical protein
MLLRQKFDQQYRPDDIQDKKQQILFVLVLILFPTSVVWFTSSLDYRANLFPITLSIMSLSLLTLILAVKAFDYYKIAFGESALIKFVNIRIFEKNKGIAGQLLYFFSFISYLLMNLLVGFPIASVIFINSFILFHNRKAWAISLPISGVFLLIMWLLATMLVLQFPSGLLGAFVDLPWWLGGELN